VTTFVNPDSRQPEESAMLLPLATEIVNSLPTELIASLITPKKKEEQRVGEPNLPQTHEKRNRR
jgi:hypothetical protein